MKTNLIRTLTLSAAALTLVSLAYAQTTEVAAIPFPFLVRGAQMPAGTYTIQQAMHADPKALYLTNGHDRNMVVGVAAGYEDTKGARLVFSCRESTGCVLREIWNGRGSGVAFPMPKLSSAEKERLAVIFIHRSESD